VPRSLHMGSTPRQHGITVGLVLPKRVNVQNFPRSARDGLKCRMKGARSFPTCPRSARHDQSWTHAREAGEDSPSCCTQGNRGRIIAVDISRFRLESLKERARRGGVTITETVIAHENGLPPLLRDVKGDVVTVDATMLGNGDIPPESVAKTES